MTEVLLILGVIAIVAVGLAKVWRMPLEKLVQKPVYMQTIGLHWIYIAAIIGGAVILSMLITGIK